MTLFRTRDFGLAALSIALFAAAAIVGCNVHTNRSSAEGPSSTGKPVKGDVPTVRANSLTGEILGQTVIIEGEVIQQCPSVGCWFRVKDQDGEAFVDLNPAKLHLQENYVGQRAKVTGRVAKRGARFQLEAQHVEFAAAVPESGQENK